MGQLVGSLIRAAGFAMCDSMSADFSSGRLYQKFFGSEAGLGDWGLTEAEC
ncbi:hypothetical protein PSCICM_24420 [Pseudomonas cichorii]|nr:hypothetical protein PSCICM_24420 [Pseudomonas cichorii]